MPLSRFDLRCLVFAVVLGAVGCGGSDNTSPTTTPSQTLATDILRGTVPPPVDDALQSAFGTFAVAQGGGSVSVTLTSAVETLPGGSLLTTITMGIGIGTVTNGACVLLANAFTTAQAGSSPQLSGTLAAGTYCIQVSDVSSQLGPVAFAVAVSHP